MQSRTLLFLLTMIFLACVPFSAHGTTPPRAKTVMNKVNRLWLAGEFSSLNDYLFKLNSDYPDYVPVRIVQASWTRRRQGSDIEAYLPLIRSLDEDAKANMRFFSPLFFALLRSGIIRAEKALEQYEKDGWTQEVRRERTAPDQLKHRVAWLEITSIMRVAPEVSLSSKLNDRVVVHYRRLPEKPMTIQQARTRIEDARAGGTVRATGIRFLGYQHPDGQLPFLARWLRDYAPQVAEAAAETVSNYGEAALPFILEAIDDKSLRLSTREFCVWALIRLDSASPEIEKALQALTESRHYREREYATEALVYLRNQKRQVSDSTNRPGMRKGGQ